MHDRVHACLDGELPREALTPDELARLSALEWAVAEAATELRATPAPDLTARVMESLPEASRAPAWSERLAQLLDRAVDWLWRPRTLVVRYRPAYALGGFAAAALAATVTPVTFPSPAPLAPVAVEREAGAPRLYVQFRLEAPGASEVALAGSFTGWRPEHELREVAPGVWTALVPLDPGVHDYTFVVDGEEWVVDPYAPQVDDSFGGSNSRLFLPSPSGRA